MSDADAISSEVIRLVERQIRSINARLDPEFLIRIGAFSRTLAAWGARMNLTAHPDDPREIAFHILDSLAPVVQADVSRETSATMVDRLALEDAFDTRRHVLDLGGGAGFPGLILAAATEARFTIAESRRKRASFLTVAIAEMGLHNASVLSGRVDESTFHVEHDAASHELARQRSARKSVKRAQFDVVVARALGAPSEFYRIAAATLHEGGLAILYANPDQRLSLDIARESGLTGYARIPYEIRRGDSIVRRVFAIWRRA